MDLLDESIQWKNLYVVILKIVTSGCYIGNLKYIFFNYQTLSTYFFQLYTFKANVPFNAYKY